MIGERAASLILYFVVVLLASGDCIGAAKPAVEIDLGAAAGAKGMVFLLGGFAAERARPP